MTLIHSRIRSISSGRNLLLATAGLLLLVFAFAPLTLGLQESTGGFMPFDNQFPLTAAMMSEQLALYNDTSRRLYAAFAVVDMVFPPVFSLFFALLWGWLLRNAPETHPLLARRLLWLPFISAGCDWLENVGNIWIIYGAAPEPVYTLALGFKYLKLCAVVFNIGIALWLTRAAD